MDRLLIILFLVFVNIIPVLADTDLKVQQQNTVKETYKINGHIEYDDNPVETIYLDENIEKPKVNVPKRSLTLPVKVLNITSNADSRRSALATAMLNRNSLNDILPLNAALTDHYGGFSYGHTWGQEISYSQLESTSAFFLRYDAKKWFSITGTAKQVAKQNLGTQYNAFSITPEWHITDKLTIKDSFTDYIDMPRKKNQVTFVYTPALRKYADSLKFELGLAQSYYDSGKQSAEVSFSTGFRL